MPRKARIRAESGIYHIMLHGVNCQQIFEDEEDNKMFLQILRDSKEICGYDLLAYCLMGNHVHLLLKEGKEGLGQIFKRIGAKYVYWYNGKYQRTGHLFQDRFKSEVVEDERYLFTVIRYIHQNPLKAGCCTRLEDYPYSSFQEYIGKADLINLEEVEQYISREAVIEMSREELSEQCLEMREAPPKRITDQEAKRRIQKISGCNNPAAFQGLGQIQKEKFIRALKGEGLSVRQISRLTGVTYYAIQKTE